jgi:hypothetical protein
MLRRIKKSLFIISASAVITHSFTSLAHAAPVVGVAVGMNITATTTDSTHWTVQKSPYFLNQILWNGRQWMAVGFAKKTNSTSNNPANEGIILTSTDGINWKIREDVNVNDYSAVGWDGKRWLIISSTSTTEPGSDKMRLWSTDNDVKELKEIDAKLPFLFYPKIKNDGSQWLITAFDAPSPYNSPLLHSKDGENWTKLPTLMRRLDGMSGITFPDGSHQWVMVGSGGIVTSQDTVNWIYQSNFDQGTAVQWNGTQWAVASYTPYISNSKDGSVWKAASSPDKKCNPVAIDWDPNNEKWTAVGAGITPEGRDAGCIYTGDKTGNTWTTTQTSLIGTNLQSVSFRKLNS